VDEETSVSCDVGYVLETSDVSGDDFSTSTITYSSTCIPCKSPCKECMLYADLCVSCISDEYRLNGTTCLKKLAVGIDLKFDAVFT
jgi:hypothetical protein